MKFDMIAKVAKFAAAGIVANGTRKIVAGIIENNVTVGKPKDKIAVVAATWVISGIVATAAKKYSDETIDGAVKNITEGVLWMKNRDALARINKGETTFEQEGLDEADYLQVDGKWARKEKESVPAES